MQDVFKQVVLIRGQVSPRLFFQDAENVDGLLGQGQVFDLLAGAGLLDRAQVNQCRRIQRKYEGGKIDQFEGIKLTKKLLEKCRTELA